MANVRWPLAGAGWTEPPIIWAAGVGFPGDGKSPAIDRVCALLQNAEEELGVGFDDERREYETKKQVAKACREKWEKEVADAIKNGVNAPLLPEEANEPNEPMRPRIRVADVTTERLGALAAGLPRGLLLVRDELAGWLGGFDRYGGGGSDRAFALEMYGGRQYVVDRQKHPEPIRIPHLSVGVLGGVQPEKLNMVVDTPDDGLISRILWAWPENIPTFVLARQKIEERDAKLAFNRLCHLGMNVDDKGVRQPRCIPLSTAAENALEAFAQEMSLRGRHATGPLATSISKARGHCLRLACVIEFLWWAGDGSAKEPASISEASVRRAAGLLDAYYLPMAQRVFGDAAVPEDDRKAMALVSHLRSARLRTFNANKTRLEIGGPLRATADMKKACATLVEAGLIRESFTRAGESIGRTAKNYAVNPIIYGGAQ